MAFNPREIAKAGRRMYERHRQDFERRYQGKYVLIDIRSEKVFVAESRRSDYNRAETIEETAELVTHLGAPGLAAAVDLVEPRLRRQT